MQLVHPYREQKPNMVLVEGMREGKSGLTVEKPLVIYESQGVYTEDVLRIYREEEK